VKSDLLRVVIDTNVIVSAALRANSIPAYMVSAGLARKFLVSYSRQIMNEYREVLIRGKFQFPLSQVDRYLSDLKKVGEQVFPRTSITICPDPDDNKFLDCAEEAGALYLVTGNKRHFPIKHGQTSVVSPRQFVMILVSAGIL